MEEVFVAGAAMTQFGKHLERSSRELVEEAVAGALTGQESIRGQVMLALPERDRRCYDEGSWTARRRRSSP